VVAVLAVVLVVAWGTTITGAAPAAAEDAPICNGITATIVGTDGDDDLTGTGGDDVVWLGPGDDTFVSYGGTDTVCGESGADVVTQTSGTFLGGPGNDTFQSPEESGHELTVRLGSGADRAVIDNVFLATVWGDEGRDVFQVPDPVLGADADRTIAHVDGGPGVNRLTFAGSHHKVQILANRATALWGRGTVTFSFVDEFVGSQRGDRLVGNDLVDDRLFGSGGDDVLEGKAGDDRLIGGPGRDAAFGGRDHDTCHAEVRHSC
jgi:Ca2+-binding RTX toxin-like protein